MSNAKQEATNGSEPLLATECFPFIQGLTYLDSAKLGLIHQNALQELVGAYENHPLAYTFGEAGASKRVPKSVDVARGELAETLKISSPRSILFGCNTTQCINLVSHSFQLAAGDEIIISDLEHVSNAAPWLHLAKSSGASIRIARSNQDFMIEPGEIESLVSKRTRIIAHTYVSNLFGSVQPVDEIHEIARKYGIAHVVDAAQAGGRIAVEPKFSDYMAFCGRKAWLGSQGSAFLYYDSDSNCRLSPRDFGSFANTRETETEFTFVAGPRRFEAGGLNMPAIVALAASAKTLASVGLDSITAHVRVLTHALFAALDDLPVRILACRDIDHQAGIVSMVPEGEHVTCESIARRLRAVGILCSYGTFGAKPVLALRGESSAVRVSFHGYNSTQDVQRLSDELTAILGKGHVR